MTGTIPFSWMLIMATTGSLFILFFLYHKRVLPFPDTDTRHQRGEVSESRASFLEIIRAYFRQEKVLAIVAFILLYRTGEAMLVKLVSPFLLDPRAAGGLGLSTEQVGLVYGTVGITIDGAVDAADRTLACDAQTQAVAVQDAVAYDG